MAMAGRIKTMDPVTMDNISMVNIMAKGPLGQFLARFLAESFKMDNIKDKSPASIKMGQYMKGRSSMALGMA
jgi:hypothetical protein